MEQRLKGQVALVTGASRGAGRGIALVLGEEAATVYVTGRSVRGQPATGDQRETIDETAGARAHYTASRLAAPLMMSQGRGLVVSTTFWDRGKCLGSLRPLSEPTNI